MSADAKAVFMQLLAIADHARQVRQELKTQSPSEVDGILEAYAATRILCHGLECGEKTTVSLLDLGRIAEDKQYTAGELRAILASVEIECFKAVGALAAVISLMQKEEASKS